MLALALLLLAASPQEADPEPAAGTAPASATAHDPVARALWERVCAATRPPDAAEEPIRAFVLGAEVLSRDGVQTNEFRVDYRYLEPHYIRFRLPSGRETGRGPGERRMGYWLRDDEEVVRLFSREHTEDRRLIDDMLAIARNFIALSDPGRILPRRLVPGKAPADLPPVLAREVRDLEWLVLESPDFALLRQEPAVGPEARRHRVDLGVDPKTDLPALARILSVRTEGGVPDGAPLLIRLGDYRALDGFRVPHRLLVHRTASDRRSLVFDETPYQEIYVLEANLRPTLSAQGFEP